MPRGGAEPLLLSTEENGLGTVSAWADVPGALIYNVVRGELKALREMDEFFHLGQLTCVAAGTTQASTAGSEDLEFPPPGGDGLPRGYGTESAAKERFAPPGQVSVALRTCRW